MVSLTARLGALATLAVGVAILVGVGTGSGAPARPIVANGVPHVQSTGASRLTPPLFAAVSSGSNSGPSVELRSAATGRVTAALGPLGRSWTNNGFALSPDGRYVYFTLIPKTSRWNSLWLERLSVSTRQRRLIAHGEEPSVSPDGRLLAYAKGEDRSATIVVRDLASGKSRSLGVARLLASNTDMVHASLAWLGNGSQLAVLESCCPIAVSRVGAQARPPGDGLHLIVISVTPHGRLSARLLALPPGTQMPDAVGTDGTRPGSLLISWLIAGDRAAVYRLTIGPSRSTLRRVLTIAHALVTAFAPNGRALLYLVGDNPPNLWAATLDHHRLTQRHLLIRNAALDAYAW